MPIRDAQAGGTHRIGLVAILQSSRMSWKGKVKFIVRDARSRIPIGVKLSSVMDVAAVATGAGYRCHNGKGKGIISSCRCGVSTAYILQGKY
jgi:hypothetical protein